MREIPELLPMVGEQKAIDFLLNVPVKIEDEEMLCRVIKRIKYRFDQCVPVTPKFNKGKYGKKYDSWRCGKCAYSLPEAGWNYCPNCGYTIKKNAS